MYSQGINVCISCTISITNSWNRYIQVQKLCFVITIKQSPTNLLTFNNVLLSTQSPKT